MLTNDKIRGCYWGLTIGDALGMPVEFKSIEAIRSNYGDDLDNFIIVKGF